MKISFCIPTYNRCDVLEELIKSISTQKEHPFDIEICITDNASTDGTSDKIDEWREKYLVQIVYKKNECNVGPDRNYLAAVALASGDYCWLMGSDDMLSPDALYQLNIFMHNECELYLCDRREFDINMKEIKYEHRKWLDSSSIVFSFENPNDYASYFDKCRTLGGVFSYLSSLIFKRDEWNKISLDESYIGSAYVHVYFLLSMIKMSNAFRLQYIAQPLVFCRGENDHFSKNGRAKRVEIDLKSYTKLAYDFYENEITRSKFLNVLSRERPRMHTSLVVGHYGDNKIKESVSECYKKMGKKKWLTSLFFMFGTLGFYVNKLGFFNKKITPLLRSIR